MGIWRLWFSLFYLAKDGASDDQNSPDNLRGRHGFPQKDSGEQKRGNRVNIADHGNRLRRQLLQAGKTEQIGKPGVYQPDDEQIWKICTLRMRETGCQHDIDQNHYECDIKLDGSRLKAAGLFYAFVEDNQRGIKTGRQQLLSSAPIC